MFLATLLIAVLLPFSLAGVAYGHSGFALSSPYAKVVPTMNGIEDVGEWAEMSYLALINIPNPTGGQPASNPAYLKVKNDGTNLYIMLDWHNDGQAHSSGCVYLGFDTLHDGAIGTDDYMWHCCPGDWQGNATGGWDLVLDTVIGATHYRSGAPWPGDLAGACQHPSTSRLEEIKIPLANISVTPGDTIGFFVWMTAETDPWAWANAYTLPSTPAPGTWTTPPSTPPSNWANLTLAPAMYAPPLTVTPTIDGNWSAGEWADAPQYTMKGPAGETSYIRAKHDGSKLYVIIDWPWDNTSATLFWHENVWLAFDTLHDGGAAPQPDDYLVHPTTSWTGTGWVGNGTGWNATPMPGVSAVCAGENWGAVPLSTSPNDPVNPHRISEMAIPLTYVGPPGSTVGFYAQVEDDSTNAYAEWPTGAGGSPAWPPADPCPAPSAWGTLKLSLPGIPVWDTDGNGLVDIVDVVIVALAFGSTPSDPEWDQRADISPEYGLVDIVDVVLAAIHFGESYT
ncbi:MAG: hypothetical protein ACE5J6_00145 [Candidatus Bathyarchaeia archaeon]